MTSSSGRLPVKSCVPCEEAVLIAEVAAGRRCAPTVNELELELLRLSADAIEIFKLVNLQTPAKEMQPNDQGPALAARAWIANLLIDQPNENKRSKEAHKGNCPQTRVGAGPDEPDSKRKKRPGIDSAVVFVPSEDDVRNAVEGTNHPFIRTPYLLAGTVVLLAAIATWYFLLV